MTDLPFTLHHVIEAAVDRAVRRTAGDPATTVHAMIRLYVQEDVQKWITANWQPKPTTCGAHQRDYHTSQYPCILRPGHDPIAPTISRTHIDKDGGTW